MSPLQMSNGFRWSWDDKKVSLKTGACLLPITPCMISHSSCPMKVKEKFLVAVNLQPETSGACERQGHFLFLFWMICDILSVQGTKEGVYADH